MQTNNPVWKKNRNAYAKLLLNQLKQGCLEKPFNAAPPAGPLQTLPASLTYSFSLPRTSSARSTIRSGVSVSSSQGNPASNAAEEPQLDDYLGRHASPRRTASAGTALSQGERFSDAQELDSAQLSHQKSGLWGVESNPSRQPSVSVRADSPPRRQKSGTLDVRSSPGHQRSGILRTGSSGSSLRGHESNSLHAHKSPGRAPSRLRDSSTDAEVHYAAEMRHQLPTRREGSSTEEEHRSTSHRHKAQSAARESSSSEEENARRHQRHSPRGSQASRKHDSLDQRQSPRDSHTSRQHKATEPPQWQCRTAEKYMSRARVQEALSPRRQQSPTQPYAAKARILDLRDNCTLADEEQDQLNGDRHHHARDNKQGGAQVVNSVFAQHACYTTFVLHQNASLP